VPIGSRPVSKASGSWWISHPVGGVVAGGGVEGLGVAGHGGAELGRVSLDHGGRPRRQQRVGVLAGALDGGADPGSRSAGAAPSGSSPVSVSAAAAVAVVGPGRTGATLAVVPTTPASTTPGRGPPGVQSCTQ
jgi:hypothetical protein